MHSAVYEGRVRHRRRQPHEHRFHYSLSMVWLDLDELDAATRMHPLWSLERGNVASICRRDYLGPTSKPLRDAVLDQVERALGARPRGPIRVLTTVRTLGVVFNPVSVYYCYNDRGDTLRAIVAEITNTPWRERHAYVVPVSEEDNRRGSVEFMFNKSFHVSPFMPMWLRYRWLFGIPGKRLWIRMHSLREAEDVFDATLVLRQHAMNRASLGRVLTRTPLQPVVALARIYTQALRLWMKRTPFHAHPRKASQHAP